MLKEKELRGRLGRRMLEWFELPAGGSGTPTLALSAGELRGLLAPSDSARASATAIGTLVRVSPLRKTHRSTSLCEGKPDTIIQQESRIVKYAY